MRIQHNLTAMNGFRQLYLINGRLSKSIERLSSGYSINRASDDAAGLFISEKMRSQIRGLDQAARNAQDGISLLQTADGGLSEIQNIIQRMRELSVQAANGTCTSYDRNSIQDEIDQLVKEIDRISGTTEFNTMNLLNGDFDTSSNAITPLHQPIQATDINVFQSISDAIASVNDNQVRLFIEEVSEFNTVQTPTAGTNTTAAYPAEFVDYVTKEIVPNAVQSLLNTYSSLSYLEGSSIGIGLKLYSEDSTTLAYVSAGAGGTLSNIQLTYTLAINMNAIDWNSTTKEITNRSDFEATIAHEMTHAFMDEALSCGMFGRTQEWTATEKYPTWFKEGIAQLASGPGNWIKYGLSLDENSGDASIKSDLSTLADNSDASNYGTGYLAMAYLGYLANGGTGEVTAASIANGTDGILYSLISGNSLSDTIATCTNGKYSSIYDFTSNLVNDNGICDFVRELIDNTGEGLGSIVSGSLSDGDILNDTELISVTLFQVNPTTSEVKNDYSGTGITVMSGGSGNSSGNSPIDDYTEVVDNPIDAQTPPPTPISSTITLDDLDSVDFASIGASYDSGTQTITFTRNGNYNITGINNGIKFIVNSGIDATLNCSNATLDSITGNGGTLTIRGTMTGDIVNNGNVTNQGTVTGDITTSGSGSITNSGTITGSASCSSGDINNSGKITGTASSVSGEVYHYASSYTKNITPPSAIEVGENLLNPSSLTSSITVNYNGSSKILNGTWVVTDKSGNIVSNPSSLTLGEDDAYTYTVTFDGLADDILFKTNTTSHGMTVTSFAKTTDGGDISGDGRKLSFAYTITSSGVTLPSGSGNISADSYGGLQLQIGANSGQSMNIVIDDMSADALGLTGLDVTTESDASTSIDTCQIANQKVSLMRGRLGAYQNRLEHTISNLENTSENLLAAESRIRDTDIAKEMVEYTKNLLLQQATQAILAQSYKQTEGMLQLLS